MPILPREPAIFPDDLFSEQVDLPTDAPWWAIYTLSRREKDLMRRLRAMEIPFYCPLISRKTKSPSGRVRKSHVPLFSGYVFAQGDSEQRLQILQTNCVSRTLEVDDAAQLLDDLSQIHRLIDAEIPMTVESKIQPGQAVRVISGPFAGLEGVVLQRRGVEHLIVSVQFLQQGAAVEIEDFQVESI